MNRFVGLVSTSVQVRMQERLLAKKLVEERRGQKKFIRIEELSVLQQKHEEEKKSRIADLEAEYQAVAAAFGEAHRQAEQMRQAQFEEVLHREKYEAQNKAHQQARFAAALSTVRAEREALDAPLLEFTQRRAAILREERERAAAATEAARVRAEQRRLLEPAPEQQALPMIVPFTPSRLLRPTDFTRTFLHLHSSSLYVDNHEGQ
jgi:hypothetical protein